MSEGLNEEDLDDDEIDANVQARRTKESLNSRNEEPPNLRGVDVGTQKKKTPPRLEETMSAYVDLKRAHSSLKEQAMEQTIAQGQQYSMSR